MDANVTMREVAQAAEVSVATVSRFLNGSGYVNEATARRIREAIEQTGYEPSMMARSLRTRRTRLLLLILPDVCNPFYSRMAQTLQRLAGAAGYAMLLADTLGDRAEELAAIEMARRMSVEGVLFATIHINDQANRLLQDSAFHVVGLNAFPENAPFDVVSVHSRGGTNLAVEHLAGLGHRRIAFAGGTPGSFIADSRRNGYLYAMNKHGLPVNEESVIETGFSQADGYEAGRRFATRADCPTAICCANDLIALGVIHALNDAGLRVPEDVSVTGMDDIPYGQMTRPALTTVTNDGALFAEEAFRMLLERLDGRTSLPRRVEVPNALIVRASTSIGKP